MSGSEYKGQIKNFESGRQLFDIDKWMIGATREEALRQVKAAEHNARIAVKEAHLWKRAFDRHF